MKLTAKNTEIIHALGYRSPAELLNHYPMRYETLIEKKPTDWNVDEVVIFKAQLVSGFRHFRFGNKQSVTHFQAVYEETVIKVSIYNRRLLKEATFKDGIVVIGTVSKDATVTARSVNAQPIEEQTGIIPVYPLRSGIKQFQLRTLIRRILNDAVIPTIIPQKLLTAYRLESREAALRSCHNPTDLGSLKNAIRTLKYEEFLLYQLSLALNRKSPILKEPKMIDAVQIQAFIEQLPYDLTVDQLQAVDDILADLRSPQSMNRLMQGDVGSGKTIVSLIGALACVSAGYQVAMMVPTDLLLKQHLRTVRQLFPGLTICELAQSTPNKETVLDDIAQHRCDIICGTHALFQENVVFARLGLIIIDEQHRFGVKQRTQLIEKGSHADVLMLSATPIPRTLANSLYFDLDVSTIATYPSHRQASETILIRENSIRSILPEINAALKRGEQVYVVCAAIDEGERKQVKNVVAIHQQLTQVFSDYCVDFIHGKLSSSDKEGIMDRFKDNAIQILISTSVIEVGLDVHNANTMIVYNAEMFGLATLHQLRGRIGRGHRGGTCFLLTSSSDADSIQRLEALVVSHDGFELSLMDMRLRGYGDVLGIRQSGLPHFILGDVVADEAILRQAQTDALMIAEDQEAVDHQAIIRVVLEMDNYKAM